MISSAVMVALAEAAVMFTARLRALPTTDAWLARTNAVLAPCVVFVPGGAVVMAIEPPVKSFAPVQY